MTGKQQQQHVSGSEVTELTPPTKEGRTQRSQRSRGSKRNLDPNQAGRTSSNLRGRTHTHTRRHTDRNTSEPILFLLSVRSCQTSTSVRTRAAQLCTGPPMVWRSVLIMRSELTAVLHQCLLLWPEGGAGNWPEPLTWVSLFPEAHQGASRGGEGETVSSPRLQQDLHDRQIPAAPRQTHPHRWGRGEGGWIQSSHDSVVCSGAELWVCLSRGEELHLWPVWTDLQTEETPVSPSDETLRSQTTAVSSHLQEPPTVMSVKNWQSNSTCSSIRAHQGA